MYGTPGPCDPGSRAGGQEPADPLDGGPHGVEVLVGMPGGRTNPDRPGRPTAQRRDCVSRADLVGAGPRTAGAATGGWVCGIRHG